MVVTSKTRICVKNLPPNANEQDLKEFLLGDKKSHGPKLEITDCKILRNQKNGKSRKVAFVGFRHEAQAKHVVETFHRSFLRMCRLSVEHALAKKEEQEQPEQKEQEAKIDSKKNKKNNGSSSQEDKQQKVKTTKVSGSNKSKFWANDEDDILPLAAGNQNPKNTIDETNEGNANDDDDASSKSAGSDTEEPSVDGDNEEEQETTMDKSYKTSAGLSDLDFLRSKQVAADDLEDINDKESTTHPTKETGNDEQSDSSSDSSSSSSESSSSDDDDDGDVMDDDGKENKAQPFKSAMVEPASESIEQEDEEEDTKTDESSSRLFVRNLPFETTEDEIEEYFSSVGAVTECHIPVDDQKRNKGFAFVAFASAFDAMEARARFDKVDFQGRLLHILPARPAPSPSSLATDKDRNLTWKQRQEIARREHELKNGGSTTGWSASFVRDDAVVDSLADRLGLRKGDILGVKDKLSSGDAAVRLALGETHIIEENREYFKKHGLDMEALVSATGDGKSKDEIKRSKTSILVKNLPYDTEIDELRKLFQFGDSSVNILLPPSRTIALVEYGHSTDAKRAFKKMAYRRYKHLPVYLEWAPLSAKRNSRSGDSTSAPPESSTTLKDTEPSEDIQDMDDIDGAIGVSTTLYVKNLSFNTTEDHLRQVFEDNVGKVRAVKIPQKVAPVRRDEESPEFMSMGYGFVELTSVDLVKKAMKKLQGKSVDGHAWEVTVSSKRNGLGSAPDNTAIKGKNPTKLVVRNVPFQASRQEILKLFGTFGQLRKVRLPKKFDGSHRGFAFVEFVTSKEAIEAKNALSRTHLYGRHLVLEWATEDSESIDKLREKASRDANPMAQPKNKKIRFN